MLAGELAEVARTALVEGDEALSRFILQPFQPVQPMLADTAADVGDALTTLGEASFEYKLDGARIQVHKVGDEVKVYSRNLRDVTVAVPEVVTVARGMPAREIVLDGEAIALRADGAPHPFQVTMRRFGRCRSRRFSSTRSMSTGIRWSMTRWPAERRSSANRCRPPTSCPGS